MEDTKKCPFCYEEIKKEAIKCKHCWSDLDSVKVGVLNWNPIKYKKKEIAGTIAIILWGIGGHKFYLERYWMGVIYLIFSLTFIPAVIGIIEGINYFSMKKEDWDKKYNRSI